MITPGGPGGGPWEIVVSAYNSLVQQGSRVMLFCECMRSHGTAQTVNWH